MAGLVAAALVASRKPDAFLRPQFWAEDGVVWYRQAYELGWTSLLQPQNGYFQSVSKIAANLAQSVDLAVAPLVFALVALLFKVLPVALLHSARGRALVPEARHRAFVSLLYVAHPYSWEVFINVTNIHWHLALAALLVISFHEWGTRLRKSFDCAVVVLCGLSGTFSLFLAPIAAWHWFTTRSRRALVLAVLMCLAAMLQLAAILWTGTATRSSAPLDPSWDGLWRIVGGQVTAAALLGDVWSNLFDSHWWQASAVVPVALCALLVAATVRAFRTGGHTLRYLLALGAMVFIAALLQPQISGSQGQWPLFMRPNTGGRYAFIPIVAFLVSLAWIAASDRIVALRRIAQGLLVVTLAVGVPMSWAIKPYEDVGFRAQAEAFDRAPPGTKLAIPVNPRGWSFPLEKR